MWDLDFNKPQRKKIMKYIKEFKEGDANKKYKVIFKNGDTVQFGDKRYQQYFDSTPLNLYSHLNHYDEKRRKNYYARHNKKNISLFSADALSKIFLW